jgi:hypothetical protein
MILAMVRHNRLRNYPRRLPPWAPLLLVLAVAGSPSPLRAADPPDLAELRQSLQAGWQQLQQFDERLQSYAVAHELTRAFPGEPRRQSTSRLRVRVDGANGLRLVAPHEKGPGPMGVYARNPAYSFAASKGREWRLDAIEKGAPDNRLDERMFVELDRCTLYPLSTTFVGTSLPGLLADEHFQITGAATGPSGALVVDFTWK